MIARFGCGSSPNLVPGSTDARAVPPGPALHDYALNTRDVGPFGQPLPRDGEVGGRRAQCPRRCQPMVCEQRLEDLSALPQGLVQKRSAVNLEDVEGDEV